MEATRRDPGGEAENCIPRIRHTEENLRRLEGAWEHEGRPVRLLGEPDTGVLVALDGNGAHLNPLEVICRRRRDR